MIKVNGLVLGIIGYGIAVALRLAGYHTAFHVLVTGLTLVFLVMMIYTRIREGR